MRAKTVLELLSLSSNLYLIAKDKDLFEKLSVAYETGKHKVEEWSDEFSEEDGEEQIMHKLMHKATQMKLELDKKMEEVAVAVYKKMNIAHADDLNKLAEQVKQLQSELALAQSKIQTLEKSK